MGHTRITSAPAYKASRHPRCCLLVFAVVALLLDTSFDSDTQHSRLFVKAFHLHTCKGKPGLEKQRISSTTSLRARRPSASSTPSFVRWEESPYYQNAVIWEMQTAVTSFERTTTDNRLQSLDLHAQLHFGDPEYYQFYNTEQFRTKLDAVCYELLVDDHLLFKTKDGAKILRPDRTGRSPVAASPSDQQTAHNYGWNCQADMIDYSQGSWIHADLTRQEFIERLDSFASSSAKSASKSSRDPLWKLAQKDSALPGAAAEAATALFVGPPVIPDRPRRLFTNLFLPGSTLALILRSTLWITIPSPEISVLLLDWSSLIVDRAGGLSKLSLPIVQALLQGRLDRARQLVFGQVVLASSEQNSGSAADWSLLVNQRNDRALAVAERELGRHPRDARIALLYGSSHCKDLYTKLCARGFRPVKTVWRTAWKVPVAEYHAENMSSASDRPWLEPRTTLGLLVLLPLYFVIGGMDWIATLADVAEAAVVDQDGPAAAGVLLFYLLRHVMLYIGLSKFALDWESKFQDDSDEALV